MLANVILRGLSKVGKTFSNMDIGDALGFGELITNGVRYGKLEAWHGTIGSLWFKDLFGNFENPEELFDPENAPEHEKSKAFGYVPSQISEIFYDTVRRAVQLSSIVGEEIGSEQIGELISEALSVAFEESYAGCLKGIFGVWKGSSPPDLSLAQALALRMDTVNVDYALSQVVPISSMPSVILETMVQGANQRLKELYSGLEAQHQDLIRFKTNLLLIHLELIRDLLYDLMDTLINDVKEFRERLENDINNATVVLLERVTAVLTDVETVEQRHNATPKLITDKDYTLTLLEKDADLSAIEESFNDIKSDYDWVLNEYVNEINGKLTEILDLVQLYLSDAEEIIVSLINEHADMINALNVVNNLKNKITEIYNKIRGYRRFGFKYG